jgi:hypothetical protein
MRKEGPRGSPYEIIKNIPVTFGGLKRLIN